MVYFFSAWLTTIPLASPWNFFINGKIFLKQCVSKLWTHYEQKNKNSPKSLQIQLFTKMKNLECSGVHSFPALHRNGLTASAVKRRATLKSLPNQTLLWLYTIPPGNRAHMPVIMCLWLSKPPPCARMTNLCVFHSSCLLPPQWTISSVVCEWKISVFNSNQFIE